MRHQDIADRTGKVHLEKYLGQWTFTTPSVVEDMPEALQEALVKRPWEWCSERNLEETKR